MKLANINKCHYYMSIALSKKQIFEVYCCRAFNSLDARQDFYWANNNIDEYLEKAIGTPFIMNERFPIGYCIKTQTPKICSCKIYPSDIDSISLGTLTRCNYKCPYCVVKDNGTSELTIEEEISFTEKLILALSKYKDIVNLQLTNSGEICVYKNYFDRLAKAIVKNGNIKFVDILSNGSDYESLNKFEKILEENNIASELHISFYSLKPDVYRILTGSNTLDKVISCAKKANSKDKCLAYILFKENINEIDNIIQFAHENNCNLYIAANMYDVDMHNKIKDIRNKYGNFKNVFIEGTL